MYMYTVLFYIMHFLYAYIYIHTFVQSDTIFLVLFFRQFSFFNPFKSLVFHRGSSEDLVL